MVKERAYTTSLNDIVFDNDNDDDVPLCPNKDENNLDVMDRIELLVKDGLSTDDLVPELLKVSKDKLINDILHLVTRICACDKKIVKLENSCDDMLSKNVDLSSSLACLKSENEMLKSSAVRPGAAGLLIGIECFRVSDSSWMHLTSLVTTRIGVELAVEQ